MKFVKMERKFEENSTSMKEKLMKMSQRTFKSFDNFLAFDEDFHENFDFNFELQIVCFTEIES